ncbi:MAG: hypothetical protein IT428_19890 [Planctomycetaceae bacterium]|nr:hypothetical protein [Planctomycetaceae bacterium]
MPPSMLAGVVRKIAVKHGEAAAEEVATFLGNANPRVAGVMRVRLETAKAAARTSHDLAEQERKAKEIAEKGVDLAEALKQHPVGAC